MKIYSYILVVILFFNVQVFAQSNYNTLNKSEAPEVYGGLIFHTAGWGANFTKTTTTRNDKKWLFSLDAVTMKHPKEEKRLNQREDNSKKYVYGKTNYFMTVRPSIGRQKTIFPKASSHGVRIAGNFNLGLSMGLSRPVYLIIEQVSSPDGKAIETVEPYNPDEHQPDRIKGRASYFRGWDKSTIYPGIHAKFSVNFDYSGEQNLVRAIETGISIDSYLKRIPIMAFTHNQQVFLTGYVSFNFGKKSIN